MPVSCRELMRSFGWDTADAFMQHDAQDGRLWDDMAGRFDIFVSSFATHTYSIHIHIYIYISLRYHV